MSGSHISIQERLAEARAILGGQYSPIAHIWDEVAKSRDRRLILAIAGKNGPEWSQVADLEWRQLSPELRSGIVGGLRRFADWLARMGL